MGQLERRQFLLAAGGIIAAPRIALAQKRSVRIGLLSPRRGSVILQPVLKRLAERGYVEGKNLLVEYRSADGVVERLPPLARELIEAKCDLIFAAGTVHAARALIDAKSAIPIVFVAIEYDPVRAGIVSDLRRPGGNVTGIHLSIPALVAKRVELLREMLPRARRYFVFTDRFTKEQLVSAQRAAEQLRVDIIPAVLEKPPYDFGSAFEHGRKAEVDVLLLLTSPVFFDRRETIYELAMKHRLPVSVGSSAWWTGTGWLVGYGVITDRSYARAGDIAASILEGKNPGEIPVEQPTDFEFGINLKTAKALGITIPQAILVRANRVIE
jgi:putative ABC transport system substrate-binding protein